MGKAGVQKRWTENLRKIKTLTFLGGGGGGGRLLLCPYQSFSIYATEGGTKLKPDEPQGSKMAEIILRFSQAMCVVLGTIRSNSCQ